MASPNSSPEKASGWSGSGGSPCPPGGHSRLSSADSGILVDSGWGDSLTRSLGHKVATVEPAANAQDAKVSLKTVYSCQTARTRTPAPAATSLIHTGDKTSLTPTTTTKLNTPTTQIKATPYNHHTTIRAATAPSARAVTSGDDVRRDRTSPPGSDVSGTCGRTTTTTTTTTGGSRAITRRPGVSRTINIKVLGQQKGAAPKPEDPGKEAEVREESVEEARCSSGSVTESVAPRGLRKGVPATIQVADVQRSVPASKQVVPARIQVADAQKTVPARIQVADAQKPVPVSKHFSDVQKTVPARIQVSDVHKALPASVQLSDAQRGASVTLQLAEVQAEHVEPGRSTPLNSAPPKRVELDRGSVSVESSFGPPPPSSSSSALKVTRNPKHSGIDLSPSTSSTKALGLNLSSEQIRLEPAAAAISSNSNNKTLLVPGPSSLVVGRSATSAVSSKAPTSLTLLTSTTRVIPSLTPREGEVVMTSLPPQGRGQVVVGGRGVFSKQSGSSPSEEPVRSECSRAMLNSSESDTSVRAPLTQRGIMISQVNPPQQQQQQQQQHQQQQYGTVPGSNQRFRPKVLSVPVRFVKNSSDDRTKTSPRTSLPTERTGDGFVKVMAGPQQASSTQAQSLQVQTPDRDQPLAMIPHTTQNMSLQSSSAAAASSSSWHPSSSSPARVGTPVKECPRLIIPKVNSPSQSAAATAATRFVVTSSPRPVAASPHPSSSLSSSLLASLSSQIPPQKSSVCVTSSTSPQPRTTTVHVSKQSKPHPSASLPPTTHRIRLPNPAHPPPTTTTRQPITVKHVGACAASLQASPSPFPLLSQSKSETPAVATSSSVSSSKDVVLASSVSPHPGVLLKLLEMTAGARRKEEEGGGGGGGDKVGVERRIPVLDVRRMRRRRKEEEEEEEGGAGVPWSEQRRRMDSALSWLREELASLRAMDTELVSQFRRCQETLESLKQQQNEHPWGFWGPGDADGDGEDSEWSWGWGWGLDGGGGGRGGGIGEEEEESDGAAWEDWEIAEFEKKWAENADPDGKQQEFASLATSSSNDITEDDGISSDTTSSTRESSHSPFLQDVEVSV